MKKREEDKYEMNGSEDKTKWAHPIDRGWAWLVMVGSFGVHLMSIGYQRSLGVLFVEFQEKYGASSAVTSIINGCQFLSYSTLTLLVMNYLVRRLSVRTCCQIGCIFQFFSIAASSFAPSTIYIILTQGILYGFGQALIYCPTLFILSQYFERKRPIATVLSTCGAGVGGVIFPILTRYLIDTYGLQGALLLLSCLILHQLLFTMVFTPPTDYWFDENHSKISESDTSKDILVKDSGDEIKLKSQQNCLRSKIDLTSNNSNKAAQEHLINERSNYEEFEKSVPDSTDVYFKRNVLQQKVPHIQLPQLVYLSRSSHHISSPGQRTLASRPLNGLEKEDLALSLQLLPVSPYTSSSQEQLRYLKDSSNFAKAVSNCSLEQLQASVTSLIMGDSTQEQQHHHHRQSQCHLQPESHHRLHHHNYTQQQGCHNDEREQKTHLVEASGSQHRGSQEQDTSPRGHSLRSWCSSFISVLKLPAFWGLAVYFSCGAVGTSIPNVFIPPLAKERGLTDNDAALFLMMSATMDTFGRIVPGLVLHLQVVRASTLMLLPLICCGLHYNLTPFFTDFTSLLAMSLILGFLSSSFWALQTLIVIEILGMERLATSIGFLPFFMGMATSVSFPICGALRDISGTYSSVYHYLGGMYLTAAGSLLCVKFFTGKKDSSFRTKSDNSDG